ncbi:hypothetical protein GGF48_001832, partial [Coemansia sp. RSA 921]
NVLKDPMVAPSIQAAQQDLRRNQLEDTLDKKLKLRSTRQELVDHHVLLDTTAAPSLQAKQAQLQMNMIEDTLDKKLVDRPPRDKLVEQHILNEDE